MTGVQTCACPIYNAGFGFRIWMPPQVKAFAGGLNSINISSSVMGISHSTDSARQKLNFGDVTTAGWQTDTF